MLGIMKTINAINAVRAVPGFIKAAAIQKAREITGIEALSDKYENFLAKREYEAYLAKRKAQERINKMFNVKEPDILKFKKTYTTDEERQAATERRLKEEQNRQDRLNGIDPKSKSKSKKSKTKKSKTKKSEETEIETEDGKKISEDTLTKSSKSDAKVNKDTTIIINQTISGPKDADIKLVAETIGGNVVNLSNISQELSIDVSEINSLVELNKSINSSLISLVENQIDEQDTSIPKSESLKTTSGIIQVKPSVVTLKKEPSLMDTLASWGLSLLEGIFGAKILSEIKNLGFMKYISKSIGEIFETLMKPFVDFFKNIGATVTEIFEKAIAPLKEMVNKMWSYVDDIVVKVGSFLGLTKNTKLAAEVGELTATATKVSSAATSAATEVGEVAAKAVSSEVSLAAKAAGATGTTAAIATEGAESAAKVAGATAGKTAGKLIPGIGLGLSLFFGAKRLMEGDLAGASMELASGVAGLFPGVGTAIAIGLQGALIARDLDYNPLETKRLEDGDDGTLDPYMRDTKPSSSAPNPNAFNAPSSPVKVEPKESTIKRVENGDKGTLDPYMTDTKTAQVAPTDAPKDASVAGALENASKVTGVPLDILNKIAYVESGFNPKADSGIAKGLMQITNGTWSDLVKSYGAANGITPADDHFDVTKNALLGAFYIKELMAGIGSIVSSPTATDVYMTYFLGSGGGKKFLQNMIKNGDAPAAPDFQREAKSNPAIFYDKSGTTRTYKQIYSMLGARIGGASSAVPTALVAKTTTPAQAASTSGPSDIATISEKDIPRGTLKEKTTEKKDPFSAFEDSFAARRDPAQLEASKKRRDEIMDKVSEAANKPQYTDKFSKQFENSFETRKPSSSGSINSSSIQQKKSKKTSTDEINSSFSENYFTLSLLKS